MNDLAKEAAQATMSTIRETDPADYAYLALEVKVREGWHTPGKAAEPQEYRIVLTTGGPHIEVTGYLGLHSEPTTAELAAHWGGQRWSISNGELLAFANTFNLG